MRMCKKGFHDLDRPGNLVKRGRHKDGRQKYSCGPCVAGRTTEWDTFYRSTHDRLVCEYGHIFTEANVWWRRNAAGTWTRKCKPCQQERNQASRTGVPRVKATQERIAELHGLALSFGVDTLVPPYDENDQAHPVPAGDWIEQSRCREGYDPDMFFPDYETAGTTKAAKGVCASCPVRRECLDWAIDSNERFGVFGGMDTAERMQEAKRRRKQGKVLAA